MINIDLNEEETAILADILENNLSDLRMEISHTDSKDFRDMLKTHKEVLKKTLAALGRPIAPGD